MGFPKDKIKKALKAAFNNRERAIEYLINVSTLDSFMLTFLGYSRAKIISVT